MFPLLAGHISAYIRITWFDGGRGKKQASTIRFCCRWERRLDPHSCITTSCLFVRCFQRRRALALTLGETLVFSAFTCRGAAAPPMFSDPSGSPLHNRRTATAGSSSLGESNRRSGSRCPVKHNIPVKITGFFWDAKVKTLVSLTC